MLDLLVNQTNAKDEEKVNDEVVLLFFGVCQIFQVSKLKKGDFDLQNRYLRKKCIGFAKANNFVKSNYTYCKIFFAKKKKEREIVANIL